MTQEVNNGKRPRGRPPGTGSRGNTTGGGSPSGSPNDALTSHTTDTADLLSSIRGNGLGFIASSDYEGRTGRAGITGTMGAGGGSIATDGNNHATSPGDDRATRSAANTTNGNNGSARANNGGVDQGKQQSIRDHSGVASDRPKGLNAKPFIAPKGQKPKGESRKGKPLLPWLDGIKPLDPAEANGLKDALIEGLRAAFTGMDELIGTTNKKKQPAEIWSTIDDDDLEFLASSMIAVGMVSEAAAETVRKMASVSYQLRVGSILLPRFLATWNHYMSFGGFGL